MMKINNQIKNISCIILSALVQSIALTTFSTVGNLYPGGIGGISRLSSDVLSDFFNINISYQIPYLLINIILAILVYKYIGHKFTIYSIFQVTIVSILTLFLKPVIVIDDIIILSVFGGIVNGFGVGLALTNNASTGGTDFISIYLSNRYKRSMWYNIFGLNCVIIVVTGLIYGWSRAFYTIIYQFCSTQIVNKMHKRYTHQTITIITKYPDQVTESIFSKVRHGITRYDAIGAYKKEGTTVLYTVINSYQTSEVVEATLKVDPKAFINVQDTKKIYGNYYQKPLD